ncbi:MAG: hypothetical protein HC838_00025 [Spirulinaceae cyanobacterium RM2_2_10]|nr:hypothetical protein [Spirulinaceae cyanobacterium RM2_2_10]
MSVELTINGQSFDYPSTGDEDWGPEATDWAVAVSTGLLQKSGGLFQLLAEVDFGNTYGLKSVYYKTGTANPANAGQFRLARADVLSWRNQANDGNLNLSVNASNHLLFNGVQIDAFGAVADTATIDLTLTGATLSADINPSSVDNSFLATMPALRIKGNNTGGSTNPIDLTATQVTAMLNVMVGDSGSGGLKGLVPAPATGDAARFLRGDGTWVAAAGTGDVVGPASSTDFAIARFDGTSGLLLQNSTATLDDSGNVIFPGYLIVNGDTMLQNTLNGVILATSGLLSALTYSQLTAQLDVMVGDSGSGGTKGLVPAPASGDTAANKFLKANATWETIGKSYARTINAQTGTTYTVQLSDGSGAGTNALLTVSNAATCVVTIPANATTAFPVGTQIDILRLGAGEVQVVGAGGVTVNGPNGADRITYQYAMGSLIKTATNTWDFFGEVSGFITATGGTITTDGNFKVHTFTSSGTFQILSGSGTVESLVVGGGGGSGSSAGGGGGAGGGGAGGLKYTTPGSIYGVGSYTVTVGAGGAAASNGSGSAFDAITVLGGGGGATTSVLAQVGGSGGGGASNVGFQTGAAGTVGQGFAGGTGSQVGANASGGGGGSSAVGVNGNTSGVAGNGGAGTSVSITGSAVTYAGGGGGGSGGGTPGTGGTGGGGNGSATMSTSGQNGTANTGGGAGGGGTSSAGSTGGSGIVILRYRFQ